MLYVRIGRRYNSVIEREMDDPRSSNVQIITATQFLLVRLERDRHIANWERANQFNCAAKDLTSKVGGTFSDGARELEVPRESAAK